MEYWYKYRNDLWKCVKILDHNSGQIRFSEEENEDKLKSNIRRAARTIEGYALCNDWDWFGTFTLNPVYHDRSDLDKFRDDFMMFIRNQRRSYGHIAAILVPELHKNKQGWHMHGLIQGLPLEALRLFEVTQKLPSYILGKLRDGKAVYDWPAYRIRFGWVDIEPIKNRDAAARYITKYLTKSVDYTAKAIDLGKHLYYVTRGLNQPERIEFNNDSDDSSESLPSGLVKGKGYDFGYGIVQWYILPNGKDSN